MHSFEVHSNESACRKSGRIGLEQVLDHVATYPNDGITYQVSDMILAAHSDFVFNNESKALIRSGAHIFLSENNPTPEWNRAVLTISQII